jgi:hypothetical protein
VLADLFGLIETSETQPPLVERNGDDEIGERDRMVAEREGEKITERLSGEFDETIFQSEDEFLDEAVAIGTGDEKPVERRLLPAFSADRAILLVGLATDGTCLAFGLWDTSKTIGAGERSLLPTAKTVEREENIDDEFLQRGTSINGRGRGHGGG